MNQENLSSDFSKINCLILGNQNGFKQENNKKVGVEQLVAWLEEKNFNIIDDRYKIEHMLTNKHPFDIIFISTKLKGWDQLFGSYCSCSLYVKQNYPGAYVVLFEDEMIVAKERLLQEYEVECLKKFDVLFDSVMFMNEQSFQKVLNDFINSKKTEGD